MPPPLHSSPYYFVPRNDALALFTPDEARSISQDRPFQDGLCGSFNITLRATTPIFIRDSSTPDQSFVLPGGSYAIPPSSIAGAVRQILGAAAFGKLKRVTDRVYSVRDLNNHRFKDSLNGRKAGWLSLTPDGPVIHECEWGYVLQTKLEASVPRLNLGKPQTALEKYQQWNGAKRHPVTGIKHLFRNERERDPHLPIGQHQITGTLVLAGQATKRPVSPGPGDTTKRYENVFGDPQGASLPVLPDVFARFVELHADPEGLWQKMWSPEFTGGRPVPVFFVKDDSSSIRHIGLSEMMRVPSSASLTERLGSAKEAHLGDDLDLPDALFGYAAETGGQGLRRRADFGLLTAVGEVTVLDTVSTLMGEPRASYHPNYLEQKPGGGLVTYLDDAPPGQPPPSIRGRKFYAARKDGSAPSLPDCPKGSKMAIKMTPLAAGTSFSGRCHVHNLRPFELGALVWSLTFGDLNNPESPYRLRIGAGKPHGLGCVAVALSDFQLRNNDGSPIPPEFLAGCISKFEQWVAERLGKPCETWRSSPQILELLAIHRHDHGVSEEQLAYPNFPDPKDPKSQGGLNGFKYAIKEGCRLPDFSSLTGV